MEKKPIDLMRGKACYIIRKAIGGYELVQKADEFNQVYQVYYAYTPMLEVRCSNDWNRRDGYIELVVKPIGADASITMLIDPRTLRRCEEAERKLHDGWMENVIDEWLTSREPEGIRKRYEQLRGEKFE